LEAEAPPWTPLEEPKRSSRHLNRISGKGSGRNIKEGLEEEEREGRVREGEEERH